MDTLKTLDYQKEIIDNIPCSVLVFDRGLRLTYANKNFCRKMYYDLEDILGKRLKDVLPSGIIEQTKMVNLLKRVLNRGMPLSGGVTYGKKYYLYKINLVRLTPEKIERIMLIIQDISDIMGLMEKRPMWEMVGEEVSDRIPLSIIELNNKFKITFVNKTFKDIFLKRGLLLGKNINEVLRPKLARHHSMRQIVSKARASQQVVERKEVGFEIPKKGKRMFNIRVIKTSPELKKEIRYIIILDDVTDKVIMGERLKETEKMAALGQVTSGVAHEINNPLSILSGYIQYMVDELEKKIVWMHIDKEDVRDYLDTLLTMERETTRIGRIATNLLHFAREKKPLLVPTNINTCLTETAGMFQRQFSGSRIKVIKNLSPGVPVIHADSAQLVQVFQNLFLNAVEAMPKGGKLSVTTVCRNRSVFITIADTGVGIKRKDLEHLFEPFYSTKGTTGTGLGLSLSYGIIKAHKGDITVRSKKRKGTKFIIKLPIRARI